MKDIADACGVKDQITDLTILCNKSCLIWVKIEVDPGGEYPPKNRVGRVKKIEAAKTRANDGKPFNDEVPF